MAGFDQGAVYYSDALTNERTDPDTANSLRFAKKKFKDFIKFEEAATELAKELVRLDEEVSEMDTCQILFRWEASCLSLREIKSLHVSKLVKLSGIVIAASGIRFKATKLSLQCRGCKQYLPNLPVRPGLEGYMLPRKCPSAQAAGASSTCPLDPFFIVSDKCKCVSFQILKLQEAPEDVPHGEMPRHIQLYVDRYVCERAVPGNRVEISKSDYQGSGVRFPYVRVLGLNLYSETSGKSGLVSGSSYRRGGILTEHEEEELNALANKPDIYETVAKSIAPSIFGSLDIKKAIACLLFGGSRKKLPDGLWRRGDINMLMLGDPGTAKSQLLKFVEQCAPIGVYTSGKGSSAAGLTASVIRDPNTRNFTMEGGAMVLADGGVVCIDEFDKMREDDRVAIHEAMEQQTISIAKAGITTTLNSRCSVLAAANSVYGRWDDTKGDSNIDFMPTILSRFDMIFIVKDEHDSNRDIQLARHVMNVHMQGNDPAAAMANNQDEEKDGCIPLNKLSKFIAYARERCGPRLSESASKRLLNQYVLMRSGSIKLEKGSSKKCPIPITIRQLEAVTRISESLAKMRFAPFATDEDVEEALRLFQVSTLEAAMTGSLEGAEGFTSESEHEVIVKLEKQLKKRFVIGSQVSEHAIVDDFSRQGFSEKSIMKVLHYLLRRGEIQYRMQRRILYRVK